MIVNCECPRGVWVLFFSKLCIHAWSGAKICAAMKIWAKHSKAGMGQSENYGMQLDRDRSNNFYRFVRASDIVQITFQLNSNFEEEKEWREWKKKRKNKLQSWQNHNYKLIWNQDALLNTSLFQENAKARSPLPGTSTATVFVFIADNLMVFAGVTLVLFHLYLLQSEPCPGAGVKMP